MSKDVKLTFKERLIATTIVIVFVLIYVRTLLDRHLSNQRNKLMLRQLIMAAVIVLCALVFVMSLPHDSGLRGQVMGLVGILISGAIALSSTTFLGNAMAGIMKQWVLQECIRLD